MFRHLLAALIYLGLFVLTSSFGPIHPACYAYSAHWWTDTAGSLAAAAEEMPAGYADSMKPVIDNIPMLIVYPEWEYRIFRTAS